MAKAIPELSLDWELPHGWSREHLEIVAAAIADDSSFSFKWDDYDDETQNVYIGCAARAIIKINELTKLPVIYEANEVRRAILKSLDDTIQAMKRTL